MITLQKIGDAIKFTFSGNTHYLQDGTIEVPVNSLSLTIDGSEMVTFKKSATNDIFLSATYGELGMTKEELVAWYKENMVDGGGSDITSGDVQSMIDESISGKQDTLIAGENITISGNVISAEGGVNVVQTTGTSTTDVMSQDAVTNQLNNKLASVEYGDESWAGSGITSLKDSNNSSSYSTITFVGSINNKPILTGKDYTKVYNFNLVEASAITTSVTSASTDVQVPSAKAVYDAIQEGGGGNNVVELTQAEYDALVSGGTVDPTAFYIITDAVAFDPSTKVDTSAFTAYTAATDTALSGKVDTSTFNTYSGSVDTALSGKQDTLSAGTGISIVDNVISATGGGGGKAVSGGTNISITTGETADTINCTLPFKVFGRINKSVGIGNSLNSYGDNSIVLGSSNNANFNNQILLGESLVGGANNSLIVGQNLSSTNKNEVAFGFYNISNMANTTKGDSGNTLFSVGNGYYHYPTQGYHNAFEVRQNGDIYIADTTASGQYYEKPMIKLQDAITANTTALGGLKLQQISQSDYDNLGTYDNSTLYIIV